MLRRLLLGLIERFAERFTDVNDTGSLGRLNTVLKTLRTYRVIFSAEAKTPQVSGDATVKAWAASASIPAHRNSSQIANISALSARIAARRVIT